MHQQGSSASHCSCVDNSILVSHASAVDNRASNPTVPEGQSSYTATQPGISSLNGQLTLSRMDVIQRSLADRGSWSNHNHQCIMVLWDWWTVQLSWCGWCEQRKIDFLQAPVHDIVNFLSQCYAEGKSYSTVNTPMSPLFNIVNPVKNATVGSHTAALRKHVDRTRSRIGPQIGSWIRSQIGSQKKKF